MSKLTSLIGALAFGGVFAYLGYLLLMGTPASSGGRKARMFIDAQNWLVDQLGMTGAGLLMIAVGVIGGGALIYSALSPEAEE